MLKSILTKTLYEKRWMIVGWSLGVAAMALLMMGFYHSFQEGGFDQALQNLPKSLQGLVGNVASLKTVPGYVSQQVFALRIPLLTLIMGIIAGSVTGLVTFGTYLLTSFVGNVANIASVEKFSPFHYYNKPAIAQYGLRGSNVLVMVGVIVVLLLTALIIFRQRDIYQR
ncbi:hypothetical protein HY218_00190 [Candidatus Saccharibacteria bacterium]|nr:hypothetical protein [Candidatus Saccharibacteria bacterium]